MPTSDHEALKEQYRAAVIAYREAVARLESVSGAEFQEAQQAAEATRLEFLRLRELVGV